MFHLIFLTFINYSGLSFDRRVGASWFRVAALFPVLWHEPSGSGHFVCSKRSVLETALKSGEIPNDFILINSIWYNRTITGARTAHPLISSTRFLSVSSHRNHQTRPFRSDCLLNFPHHCPHRHLCVYHREIIQITPGQFTLLCVGRIPVNHCESPRCRTIMTLHYANAITVRLQNSGIWRGITAKNHRFPIRKSFSLLSLSLPLCVLFCRPARFFSFNFSFFTSTDPSFWTVSNQNKVTFFPF